MVKRDRKSMEWKHDCLLGPDNRENHLKLARYEVTEEELRTTRSLLAQPFCNIDMMTITQVTFNDKKAKLLAQGINANDTIK